MPELVFMNSLFQAVFPQDRNMTLGKGDFFPVFYLSEYFNEQFPKLKNNLTEIVTTDYMIGFDGVPYESVSMDGILNNLMEQLENHHLPISTPCCHSFFFCIRENKDFDRVLKILKHLKSEFSPELFDRLSKDQVVTFLCFSKSLIPDNETESYMNSISNCFGKSLHVFVYSVPEVKFQKKKTEDSIVGATLLMLSEKGFSSICRNVEASEKSNDNQLGTLEATVSEKIRKNYCPWTNIHCSIRFSKRDFLYRYCQQALTHLKNNDSFEMIAERLYSEIVDNRYGSEKLKKVLFEAIERIPTVIPKKKLKSDEISSYESYFAALYGDQGIYTVTSTMQINMNILCHRNNDNDILQTFFHKLMGEYAEIGFEHLDEEVIQKLRSFQQKIEKAADASQKRYESQLENGYFDASQGDLRTWLGKFVGYYVDSYIDRQKCLFWTHAVNTLLEKGTEQFSENIRKSAEIYRSQESLKEEINGYRCYFTFGDCQTSSYAPSEFVHLYENREYCKAITNAYTEVMERSTASDEEEIAEGYEYNIRFSSGVSLETYFINRPMENNVDFHFEDYAIVGKQYSSGYFYLRSKED